MNYFRNTIVQRLTGTLVSIGLLLAIILPSAGLRSSMSDQVAAFLFGRSIDVPLDELFLDSWGSAQNSSPETLTDFVEEFVRSYELNNGLSVGTIGFDTHALWTVLMGISLNVDPYGMAASLMSTWKSTTSTVTLLSSLQDFQGVGIIHEYGSGSSLALDSIHFALRSLLSSINPQGP